MCWFLKTSSSHSSSSQSDSSPWKRRVLKWNLEENFFSWILLLWFLLKHKQAQISNIQRPCRVEASHDSNPFFFLNHLSSGKVWWWWRQMLFVIYLRICKDTSNNWIYSLWWWHPFWHLWWPFQNAIKMLSSSKIFCQSYFFFGAAFFFFFFAFSSSSLTNSGGGL